MRSDPPRAEPVAKGRKTLRDLAVGMVWIAGFLGTVQATDVVSMSVSLSLMTFSATYLAFRGTYGKTASGKRSRLGFRGLLRVLVWVVLGPLVAAFAKLQAIVGFDHRPEYALVLLALAIVLFAADRLLSGSP